MFSGYYVIGLIPVDLFYPTFGHIYSLTSRLILQYENDRSDNLVLYAKGSGGLDELVQSLSEEQAAFAYCRVNVSNDELSVRTKFVFITWIGKNVKILRKAKLSVHV